MQKLADRFRVDWITVLRWAINGLIDYANRHGGRIVLPLNFEDRFDVYRIEGGKKTRVFHETLPPPPITTLQSVRKLRKETARR